MQHKWNPKTKANKWANISPPIYFPMACHWFMMSHISDNWEVLHLGQWKQRRSSSQRFAVLKRDITSFLATRWYVEWPVKHWVLAARKGANTFPFTSKPPLAPLALCAATHCPGHSVLLLEPDPASEPELLQDAKGGRGGPWLQSSMGLPHLSNTRGLCPTHVSTKITWASFTRF